MVVGILAPFTVLGMIQNRAVEVCAEDWAGIYMLCFITFASWMYRGQLKLTILLV